MTAAKTPETTKLEDMFALGDDIAKRWTNCVENNTDDVAEIINDCLKGGAPLLASAALSEHIDVTNTFRLFSCCVAMAARIAEAKHD
jgi:hypothetical protein